MKWAYLNSDNTVREIIPAEARPIEEWYNKEFASHCFEVPDEVMPNWWYDAENNTWHETILNNENKSYIQKTLEYAINNI